MTQSVYSFPCQILVIRGVAGKFCESICNSMICIQSQNMVMIFWKYHFRLTWDKKSDVIWFTHSWETLTWSCLPKTNGKFYSQTSTMLYFRWMGKWYSCRWHPSKLVVAEGDKALSLSTIYRWIKAFEYGQQSVKDEAGWKSHARCSISYEYMSTIDRL